MVFGRDPNYSVDLIIWFIFSYYSVNQIICLDYIGLTKLFGFQPFNLSFFSTRDIFRIIDFLVLAAFTCNRT